MKIKNLQGLRCTYCSRLPVLTDEEMKLLNEGQPLNEVMQNAYNLDKAHELVSGDNNMQDANNVLSGLLDMFADDTEKTVDDTSTSLTESDVATETLFYIYKETVYAQFKYNNHRMIYCPFCGKSLY